MHEKNGVDEAFHESSLIGNVSIGVQAENFRALIERQGLNVVHAVLKAAIRRRVVVLKVGELVAVLHDLSAEVFLEHSVHKTNILLVSNTTTIIYLSDKVVESNIGYCLLRSQVLLQLLLANVEV